MRHRTSPERKRIEAEVQARRQAAYDAVIANRHASSDEVMWGEEGEPKKGLA